MDEDGERLNKRSASLDLGLSPLGESPTDREGDLRNHRHGDAGAKVHTKKSSLSQEAEGWKIDQGGLELDRTEEGTHKQPNDAPISTLEQEISSSKTPEPAQPESPLTSNTFDYTPAGLPPLHEDTISPSLPAISNGNGHVISSGFSAIKPADEADPASHDQKDQLATLQPTEQAKASPPAKPTNPATPSVTAPSKVKKKTSWFSRTTSTKTTGRRRGDSAVSMKDISK